jgi:hypothetical protein
VGHPFTVHPDFHTRNAFEARPREAEHGQYLTSRRTVDKSVVKGSAWDPDLPSQNAMILNNALWPRHLRRSVFQRVK